MEKKRIKYFIYFVAGIIGILDTIIVRTFVQGMDLGVLMPAVIGVVFIFFSFKPHWEKHLKKVSPILIRLIYWGFILLITVFIIAEGCIILGGYYTQKPEKQPEYVIVLGAGIREDGSPTLSLVNRLDWSIRYAAEYPDTIIVVTGGQGKNEPVSEAQAMARYLVDRGVDPQRIVLEDKSTSTMENFKFTREIIGEQREIAFITNDFHVFRSTILARRNGFKAFGYGTSTPGIVWVNNYLREFFALFKSIALDY